MRKFSIEEMSVATRVAREGLPSLGPSTREKTALRQSAASVTADQSTSKPTRTLRSSSRSAK